MNHQRLKCYVLLLDVARMVPTLVKRLPRGNYFLEDQLKRALGSAMLNLAEGNARRSQKERNRFFDISLASIAETASALDIIQVFGFITHEYAEDIKSNLRSSYAMLRKLKKRI